MLEQEINLLLDRSKDTSRVPEQFRRERIDIYSNGLLSKFRQAELTLLYMRDLSNSSPKPTDSTGYSDFDRIHFYSDSFWAFSRSTLDILAQLVNQTENLQLNESQCDFRLIVDTLNRTCPGDPLTIALSNITTSGIYNQLNSYRNCSLHRRQVYLEYHQIQKLYSTPGYATGSFTAHEWHICDDPLVVDPSIALGRILVDYCEGILSFLKGNIEVIIIALLP